jgi:hypothetical protein
MSQPFGYKGVPGTCLWCGRVLRFERVTATAADEGNPSYKSPGLAGGPGTILAGKPGRYMDGCFCGLDCGYQFGKAVAGTGTRLELS